MYSKRPNSIPIYVFKKDLIVYLYMYSKGPNSIPIYVFKRT